MTEAEWLASEDVVTHLKGTDYRPDGRKIRLLICAWCRRRWDVLDERYRWGIEVAERFADGLATADELSQASQAGRRARQMYGVSACYARRIQYTNALTAFRHLAHYPSDLGGSEVEALRAQHRQVQLATLRDIFGNPFRPITFSPDWRTETAGILARQMYETREFSAMPILTDALQDAGCDSPDILDHCRDTSLTHVRGCWVVDLVLNKS